jgi:hypothetical protein
MFFFFLEFVLRNKHREVTILNTKFFKFLIEELLNIFPNIVGSRSQNIAAGNVIILNKFSLLENLRVPIGEVLLLCIENGKFVTFCPLTLFFLVSCIFLLFSELLLLNFGFLLYFFFWFSNLLN